MLRPKFLSKIKTIVGVLDVGFRNVVNVGLGVASVSMSMSSSLWSSSKFFSSKKASNCENCHDVLAAKGIKELKLLQNKINFRRTKN